MTNPQIVSVIMPAYNAATSIQRSISSVLQQVYPHWELIVVDDGSTDNTAAIVQLMATTDSRIKYIFQQNSKQGKARNNGIRHASGSLIAFIDADDTWVNTKLEKQVAYIATTGADMVFSDITVIDEQGKQFADSWRVEEGMYKGDAGKIAFMWENKAPLLTVLATKKSLELVNGFNESEEMQYVEDYDLWLRMLQGGAMFASTKEKLDCYTWHTKKSPERKRSLIHVINIFDKITIDDKALQYQKEKAMMMWAGKIVKRSKKASGKNDMRRIITLFSSVKLRSFFSCVNFVLGAAAARNAILLYTKRLAK